MNPDSEHFAMLRLWQLISPALPIGAYSYSQGLEYATEAGWVGDEHSAAQWIVGLLKNNLGHLDVPIFARIYAAFESKDHESAGYWNDFALASRESLELKNEDLHLGQALYSLLTQLGANTTLAWPNTKPVGFLTMFALAAVHWRIPKKAAAMGLLWTWCENQVAAAIKSIPLGQTAGQRILSQALNVIPGVVDGGFKLQDDDIGALSPAFAIGSALHETQYTRLFRS
jgi:urease accessory protein